MAVRPSGTVIAKSFDLVGLHVGQVRVDGNPAAFKRDGQELVITPAAGVRKGRAFEVAVDYDGHPNPIIDPDKSKDGWITTDDGAFVVNEPQGSPSARATQDLSRFDLSAAWSLGLPVDGPPDSGKRRTDRRGRPRNRARPWRPAGRRP
jgi:hypothetical protein